MGITIYLVVEKRVELAGTYHTAVICQASKPLVNGIIRHILRVHIDFADSFVTDGNSCLVNRFRVTGHERVPIVQVFSFGEAPICTCSGKPA